MLRGMRSEAAELRGPGRDGGGDGGRRGCFHGEVLYRRNEVSGSLVGCDEYTGNDCMRVYMFSLHHLIQLRSIRRNPSSASINDPSLPTLAGKMAYMSVNPPLAIVDDPEMREVERRAVSHCEDDNRRKVSTMDGLLLTTYQRLAQSTVDTNATDLVKPCEHASNPVSTSASSSRFRPDHSAFVGHPCDLVRRSDLIKCRWGNAVLSLSS